MKTVLVTGAQGQLGKAIQKCVKNFPNLHIVFTTRKELDITNENAVHTFFEDHDFDFVINCAAYTAVDKAETEVETTRLVNATAVEYLAKATVSKNIPLIQISTDYVFDGTEDTARTESDKTNPINIYGQTKLEGEKLALTINPKSLIIRTSWVYSEFGNNFVKTMLRLFNEKDEIGVIDDQIGSPTNANDLAYAIMQIISTANLSYGIFNYSNEGQCTWFQFASKIKEITHANIKINPIPSSSYPTPAKRPGYSLLDKSKIKNTYHLEIKNWQNSLENLLENL